VKAEGWSHPEDWGTWSEGASAEISIRLAKPTSEPLVLDMEVMGFSPDGPLIVGVEANGHPAGEWEFAGPQAMSLRSVPLPVDATTGMDVVTVTFQINQPRSPASCGRSEDKRLLGIGVASLTLRNASDPR
jgi:hypothetical protein